MGRHEAKLFGNHELVRRFEDLNLFELNLWIGGIFLLGERIFIFDW